MINPRRLEAKYVRYGVKHIGSNIYFGYLGRVTRKAFRRASDALDYAKRVYERWCRLYDAAILDVIANAGQEGDSFGQETKAERTKAEQGEQPYGCNCGDEGGELVNEKVQE